MRVERRGVELVTGTSTDNGASAVSGLLSNKRNRRRQRKSSSSSSSSSQMPTAVMRLFRACRDVFSNTGPGIVPSPEEVERIRSVLDKMKATNVNVSPKMPYFKKAKPTNGTTPITYLHLYECDKFSIGIFCLPRSSVIPLHNHPGMTVFSKILFGSMHIKSYDWVDVPEECNGTDNTSQIRPPPGVRLAKVKTDADFTAPCNTSILYPTAGGNMHCFTAVTSCAVLDVLGPPYSDPEGRHCTYYNVIPYDKFAVSDGTGNIPSDGEYAWLEERDKLEDFSVFGAEYTGPKIVDQ